MVKDSTVASDFRLEFVEHAAYLYAYVDGLKDSSDIRKRYWSEVFGESQRRNRARLLVEENLVENITAAEVYEVAKYVAETAPSGTKLAFVDRRPDHQELNRFGNLVANNRGLDSQVFDTLQDAENWLLGG